MADTSLNSPTDATRVQPSPQVALVLDQHLEDLQNGNACTREELLNKHPDLKDELVAYLDGIEMIAGLGVGSELVPKQLGDFEIIKPIGRGAMGVVYLANQVSLKRKVALKVLRYSMAGQQATKRFEREAELVATLRHSNIVPIYATGQQNNSHYLAMQLIDGPSLSQWSTDEEVQRDPKTIANWGAQVARALAHAHQRDVIHRDVKPSNLLKDQDHIWLTDFGLARRYDDLRMSMTGAMLGTPNYMSPEQASPTRYPIDYRTDIYSLGATLFELLTGRCVFLADTPHAVLAQVIAEEPQPLREICPNASRDLETLLLKCLEKDPAARYQTAEQLADDLDAFAEDRSIKARRPNLIERATRWKRKNQQIVSAAAAAMAAAVMLLAVSLAIWIAWKDSVTGTIKITSNEGPIVGRLIDDRGTASPTFTIPTHQPLPFTEGEYTLQMWAGGRIGENQRISVTAGSPSEILTKISDEGVFEERTVRGIPKPLPLGDRDDLLLFHNDGITRLDGRSGKELWIAEVEKLAGLINKTYNDEMLAAAREREKANEKLDPADRKPFDVKTTPARVKWKATFGGLFQYDEEGDHDKQNVPAVAEDFPDINADGHQEVMIACRKQAVLFAFDGQNGNLLWHYNAGHLGERSRTLHDPLSLGDIDDDGIADFGCLFFSSERTGGKGIQRWLDAVSGKTGKRIWRLTMPTDWFNTTNAFLPSFCQTTTLRSTDCGFFPHIQFRPNQWGYRYQRFKQKQQGELVPWAPVPNLSPDSGGEELLIACGTRIVSCDAKTGKPGSFNEGQPIELGFVPALQPQLVRTPDDNGETLGLLLTEIVSSADPSSGTKAITRFSLRSVDSGAELWRYDAACDPEWMGTPPDWPMIADLDGDAVPEILVCDGADLGRKSPSRQSSVQALNGLTGKPLWKTDEAAKIRSQDRQIQHVLVGPDDDGDQLDDVYVVTPMVKSEFWIFVDILSGATGKRIRTVCSKIPVFGLQSNGLVLERPFFLGEGFDQQRLVVASKAIAFSYLRQSTVIMSLTTGELTNVGDQLEHPILADGDGDGSLDLFLLKPRDRSKLLESGQLVTLKSTSGGVKLATDTELSLTDDVDSDGVRDLIDAKIGQNDGSSSLAGANSRKIISGVSGKRLFEWEFQDAVDFLHPLNADLNNDGVHDYLAETTLNDKEEVASLALVSGANGTVIWQQETTVVAYTYLTAKCEDMDLDGQPELLLFQHYGNNKDIESRFRLACLNGQSGNEMWNCDLVAPGSQLAQYTFHHLNYESRIFDANSDGIQDVICPGFNDENKMISIAISGKDGKPIWTTSPRPADIGTWMTHWHSEVVPTMGEAAVLAMAAEGRDSNSKPTLTVDFFDLASGTQISTWSGSGRFPKTRSYYRERSQTEEIPLAIAVADKRLAGLILSDGNAPELVVIDFSAETAKEVHRISSGELVLLDDINDDGRTDGIFRTEKDFVTVDLVSGKELNRKPLPSAVNVKSIKYESEYGLLSLETKDGENRQLTLVDPVTLDVKWNLHWPRDTSFSGLLCCGDTADQGLAVIPRALFSNGKTVVVAVASPTEFRGDPALLASRSHSGSNLGIDRSSSAFDDPRLIEPLPWNYYGTAIDIMEIEGLGHSPVVMLTQIFPIVLGAIVFPTWFVCTMIRRKRWSLRWLLLSPLVFILPYLLLQMPSELGAEYAASNVMPFWWGKFMAAIKIVPFLVFISVFVKHCFNWNWKPVCFLMLFTLLAPALLAVPELASTSLHAGGRYDWLDPGSLGLLWAGVWIVGIGILIWWLVVSVGTGAIRFFGSLRTQRKPAMP